MHDYLLSTEIVRFAFIFGVAVSMLLYERRHITTGSIVVPGYMATFIVYPFIIVATFINALLSYVVVNRFLRRWFLLYGRTKFTILALVSILIQTAMLKFTPSGPWLWESDFKLFVGVGYVVPALIAHDMGRQGIGKTVKSVMMAAAIVATPVAFALLADLPGVNDLAPLQGGGDMAIEPKWIPLAVLLSAAASWGVAHNYGYRSGGFVGAAFVGMLLGDPWQVLIAFVLAACTYVFVTKILMKNMILFGRRKFSAMLLVSSAMSWTLLWLGTELFDLGIQEHLDLGSLALTPLFIPGLLANDAQRTSPREVAIGLSLATTFVLATTWWVQSLFEGLTLNWSWKLVSVVTFSSIFWRQFVPSRTIRVVDEAESVPAPIAAPTPLVATAMPELTLAARSIESEPPLTTVPPAPVRPVAVPAAQPVATPDAAPARVPLTPAADVPVRTPMPAYGAAGYTRWASLHREAAESAERWLSVMLGDAGLVPSPAAGPPHRTPPQPTEQWTDRLRHAAIRTLHRSHDATAGHGGGAVLTAPAPADVDEVGDIPASDAPTALPTRHRQNTVAPERTEATGAPTGTSGLLPGGERESRRWRVLPPVHGEATVVPDVSQVSNSASSPHPAAPFADPPSGEPATTEHDVPESSATASESSATMH